MYSNKEKLEKQPTAASHTNDQSFDNKAYPHFTDNRPEMITQRKLSEMVNNSKQLKQLKKWQPIQPIQRMAAVATADKSKEEDIIVMSSLNYALSAAGGPLVDFGVNADFSGMQKNENLIIVAHGNKGKIGAYNGAQTVDILTTDTKAIPHNIGGITLMSCFSGLDETGPDTSLADQVADGLKDKGYTDIPVKGALGLAIASEATSARAVNPDKTASYFQLLQNPLFFKYNFVKTFRVDFATGNKIPTKLKTADEFLLEKGIEEPSKMTLEQKIGEVSRLTEGFYRELIEVADKSGHLLDVGKDGVQITWETN